MSRLELLQHWNVELFVFISVMHLLFLYLYPISCNSWSLCTYIHTSISNFLSPTAMGKILNIFFH